jgi:hypothetical protein
MEEEEGEWRREREKARVGVAGRLLCDGIHPDDKLLCF